MTLVDFRRLSSDPVEACRKIIDKLDLLEEHSYAKRIEGVKAWQQSEVNKLYLQVIMAAFSGGKPIAAAIPMQLAIPADHSVARDHQRHGVGGVCAPHCSARPRAAHLGRDLSIGAGFSIRNGKDQLQCGALEGPQQLPIDRNGKFPPLAVQVLSQLLGIGSDFGRVSLDWTLQLDQVAIQGSFGLGPSQRTLASMVM